MFETIRPNKLFSRLASVLELDASTCSLLLADLLERVDGAPITLTQQQLFAMRDGLLEMIDVVYAPEMQPRVRAGLDALLDG